MNYATEHQVRSAIGLVLIIAAAAILAIGAFNYYTKRIIPYQNEVKYIKMEISRSEGPERKYWESKLKRRYVRAIPFVGKAIANKMRKKSEKRR